MIGEWSRKISNQICENQNEKEIIQYGLNQLFWILLNFFAIAISGVLWHEFCFSILAFLEIYFLFSRHYRMMASFLRTIIFYFAGKHTIYSSLIMGVKRK